MFDLIRPAWATLLRAPADDNGGGADTAPGAGGDDTAPGAGGDDTVSAGDGGDGNSGAAKWFEDRRFDADTQTQLKALGLTVDDPLDAVKSLAAMERAAKQKLGRGADKLIEKPGEGQDVSEWLRANGELLGIPEDPEKYDIKPPEGWPKEAPWDADFEAEARRIAHEEGVPAKTLQRMTDLYAAKIGKMLGDADTEYAAAQASLQAELQKDWGDQYAARAEVARQAAQSLAEAAGLDNDALAGIAAVLQPKIGDANVVRLFAKLGELSGDDMPAALGGGAGSGTITPAEARAKIEEMKAPGSDYRKAMKEKSETGRSAEFDSLHKTFLKLNEIAAR